MDLKEKCGNKIDSFPNDRIYKPCVDANTREWRKRHDEGLMNLFKNPVIIIEIR